MDGEGCCEMTADCGCVAKHARGCWLGFALFEVAGGA